MPKISVIVPVYKVTQYLDECVESVLAQTEGDFEILLVDDGSPDECPALCDAWAQRESRVVSLHKENGGCGDARNYGFERARGEYVTFLDGDDALDDPRSFELMLACAVRSGADIVQANYRKLIDGKPGDIRRHGLTGGEDTADVRFRFRAFYEAGHLSYAWAKLYRREFLVANGIKSPLSRYTQDKLFNFMCYVCGAKYGFITESAVLYRINEGSMTFKYKAGYREGWIDIIRQFVDYTDARGVTDSLFDLAAFHLLFGALFVAKQEYNAHGDIKKELALYGADPLTERAMRELRRGKYGRFTDSRLLRTEVRWMSGRFVHKRYGSLARGIALLVKAGKV